MILNSLSIHRIILVTILIVHKYYTDPFYLNSDICKVGGVTLKDLNTLEQEFLDIIDFNLTVDEDEYNEYTKKLKDFFSLPL